MAVVPLLALLLVGHATALESTVNPIRKVVNMLQMMQGKVTAEGKKAEALFDKYMCYCENAESTLGKAISDAEAKIPQLEASMKEDAANKAQLEADLEKHKADRAAAKDAIAEATALRKKEAAAFADDSARLGSNLDALAKAIPAISKGMSGFLQTSAAATLRQLSLTMDMAEGDRDQLSAFLSTSTDYAPASGEIVGILKQMEDEMSADLADAKKQEAERKAAFTALIAAKEKEIEANTKAIESKTARVGELAVKLAEMENDLEDTKEGLEEDKKFLGDLDNNCKTKKEEWAAYKKMQAQELLALADTIKILNDDDALELFKKTLPGGASSFLQMEVTSKAVRQQALLKLPKSNDPRLDLLEIALKGGKIGFEKIIGMIDTLVGELKKEQGTDDDKKEYCEAELDKNEDIAKGLTNDISDLDKAIADGEEQIATLTAELEALEDAIKDLDKQVSDETEQRKEENADYKETYAANSAAVDLLGFAKNRLNKFYNPKLYKPPPKRELSEEDRITVNSGGTLAPTAAPGGIAGTGISALVQQHDAPPPPPEANLAYKKSGESSTGVIAMIDLLVADVEKENQELKMTEEKAQSDYEQLMKDCADKRAEDSKAITDKNAAKGNAEEELQNNQDALKSKKINLMETTKEIANLHGECDWLLKYYSVRKEARTGEIEALGKAKDVLKGANYE